MILNLAMVLKFGSPVHSNGKINIMFLVVIRSNNKCLWWTAIDSKEKDKSTFISLMVHAQYSTKSLLYFVLQKLNIRFVASQIIHSDRSPNCLTVITNILMDVLHHSTVRIYFLDKLKTIRFRRTHRCWTSWTSFFLQQFRWTIFID